MNHSFHSNCPTMSASHLCCLSLSLYTHMHFLFPPQLFFFFTYYNVLKSPPECCPNTSLKPPLPLVLSPLSPSGPLELAGLSLLHYASLGSLSLLWNLFSFSNSHPTYGSESHLNFYLQTIRSPLLTPRTLRRNSSFKRTPTHFVFSSTTW